MALEKSWKNGCDFLYEPCVHYLIRFLSFDPRLLRAERTLVLVLLSSFTELSAPPCWPLLPSMFCAVVPIRHCRQTHPSLISPPHPLSLLPNLAHYSPVLTVLRPVVFASEPIDAFFLPFLTLTFSYLPLHGRNIAEVICKTLL